MSDIPISLISLDYVWLTLFTHHYTVIDGVRDAVTRISEPIHHIHLSSPITAMKTDGAGDTVALHCKRGQETEIFSGFSHVIFATQANVAASLLASYANDSKTKASAHATELSQCLARFTYRNTLIINHTDETILPDDPRDWRDLNLMTAYDTDQFPPGDEAKFQVSSSHTMATHILRRPKFCHPSFPSVMQTTNPIVPPDPAGLQRHPGALRPGRLRGGGRRSDPFRVACRRGGPRPGVHEAGPRATPGRPRRRHCQQDHCRVPLR